MAMRVGTSVEPSPGYFGTAEAVLGTAKAPGIRTLGRPETTLVGERAVNAGPRVLWPLPENAHHSVSR